MKIIERLVSSIAGLIDTYGARAMFISIGIACMLGVNWWFSPERAVKNVLEEVRWHQGALDADGRMFDSLHANAATSRQRAWCKFTLCWLQFDRTFLRISESATQNVALHVSIEVLLSPVPGRIRTFLPTSFNWTEPDWRWTLIYYEDGDPKVVDGKWNEVPNIGGIVDAQVLRAYLDAHAADILQHVKSLSPFLPV